VAQTRLTAPNLLLVRTLAADLLELGEHSIDIELIARLLLLLRLGLARPDGGLRGGQQRSALGRGIDRLLLGGPMASEIEVAWRAQAERPRSHRLQVRRVPMGAFAD